MPVPHQPTPSGRGRADSVLHGANGKPLAVVEAKRTAQDAEAGRTQAKLSADGLKRETGTRSEIGKRATSTSGSMKNISKAKLLSLPIPVAPREVQSRYSHFVTTHRTMNNDRQSALAASSALFDALVHRAFRGEL